MGAANSIIALKNGRNVIALNRDRNAVVVKVNVLIYYYGTLSVFKTVYNPWRSLLRVTYLFFVYSNGELYRFLTTSF